MDLGLKRPEEKDPNTDPSNRDKGNIDHEDNSAEDLSIGVPVREVLQDEATILLKGLSIPLTLKSG